MWMLRVLLIGAGFTAAKVNLKAFIFLRQQGLSGNICCQLNKCLNQTVYKPFTNIFLDVSRFFKFPIMFSKQHMDILQTIVHCTVLLMARSLFR